MTRIEAEALVRERCRETCRALGCELNERCMALLYDTPGFAEQIEAAMGCGHGFASRDACPTCRHFDGIKEFERSAR